MRTMTLLRDMGREYAPDDGGDDDENLDATDEVLSSELEESFGGSSDEYLVAKQIAGNSRKHRSGQGSGLSLPHLQVRLGKFPQRRGRFRSHATLSPT